ncbi:MAG TPA: helix-turn-helix domain-containing protein, partial [Rhizobacter sp.]|nr:helix-turn-helix domain-containing protein [Rhizobacter sp.]
GIELQLPALRERSDKRDLIQSVLESEGGGEATLSAEAERLLMEYAWPGNIRQLRHVLRTAAALADGKTITPQHLPALHDKVMPPAGPPATLTTSVAPPSLAWSGSDAGPEHTSPDTASPPIKLNPIQANERQVLLQMLVQHRWNVSNVAKALDVSRNTLYRKLHKLHIEISHPE